MKLFLVKNHYGYFDSYVEGYIEAESEEQALDILRKRAIKYGRPASLVESAKEIKAVDLNKAPY